MLRAAGKEGEGVGAPRGTAEWKQDFSAFLPGAPQGFAECLVAHPLPRRAQAAFLPVTASSSSPRAGIMRPTWLGGPANCILRGSN